MSGTSSTVSRKSRKTSNDSSPSGTATNEHGQDLLNTKLRSVLSHSLGLPLTCLLHGNDPSQLPFLAQKSQFYTDKKPNPSFSEFDRIFSDSVEEWFKTDGNCTEPRLTKTLSEKIMEKCNSLGFRSAAEFKIDCSDSSMDEGRPGSTDIVFTKDELTKDKPSTPLALLEVGRQNSSWWQKLDQNMKYIDHMATDRNSRRSKYTKPVLCTVLTIERNETEANTEWESKIGVFLCERATTKRDRMMLLWHIHVTTLDEASRAFGNVLRATSDFGRWRESKLDDGYEYFGPNCSRVNDYVLRSYDSRFRRTNRSPAIYLDKDCRDILGGEVKRVLEIPSLSDESISNTSVVSGDSSITSSASHDSFRCVKFRNIMFWEKESLDRGLVVIATPYRPGGHEAKHPTSFVPVINQLEQLHSKDFVHGDIRGFNIVYGEKDGEGWLIDFDFGGKSGTSKYPEGYCKVLADGFRRGDETGTGEILKWHDWYALGRYIFDCHVWCPKQMDAQKELEQTRMSRFWTAMQKDPTAEEIKELKQFLNDLDEGWTIFPKQEFQDELKRITPKTVTNPNATGSPSKTNKNKGLIHPDEKPVALQHPHTS